MHIALACRALSEKFSTENYASGEGKLVWV